MQSDYHLEAAEHEYQVWREKTLCEFQRNGASRFEAEVILSEMESDPLQQAGLDEILDKTLSLLVERFSSKPRGRKKSN